MILLDIKEINDEKHKKYTGVSNKKILENAIWMAEYCHSNNKEMWIRTPIIPNYTGTKENIVGIGNFIVNDLKNIPERWDLLSFNNLCTSKYERLDMEWPLKDIPLMKKGEVEELFEFAKKTGVNNVHWSALTKKED